MSQPARLRLVAIPDWTEDPWRRRWRARPMLRAMATADAVPVHVLCDQGLGSRG